MLVNWKTIRFFRRIFAGFIPNRKVRHMFVGGGFYVFYSYFIRLFNYKKEPVNFKYQLSFVLIIKNAACYMDEWINYHKLVGVDHFYIYDNESTDNLREVLKPYIESGLVDYVYWKGKSEQMKCYNYALNKHRNETKWLGFIDDDEFVVPMQDKKITDVLEKLKIKSALSMDWIFYGSNGLKKKTKDLVIEKFTKREEKPQKCQIKLIVNPRIVYCMASPHEALCVGNFYQVNENLQGCGSVANKGNNTIMYSDNLIRINHYYTKSLEEYLLKKKRGDVVYVKYSADEKLFNSLDENRNKVQDNTMEKYVPDVKRMIKKVRG